MEVVKAQLFARKFIESGGNRTEAATAISPSKNRKSLAAIGSTALKDLNVQAEIAKLNEKEEKAVLDVKAALADYAKGAVVRVENLAAHAKSEFVRLEANKDILDRAGFRPVEPDKGGNRTLIINISGENAQRYGLLTNGSTENNSA